MEGAAAVLVEAVVAVAVEVVLGSVTKDLLPKLLVRVSFFLVLSFLVWLLRKYRENVCFIVLVWMFGTLSVCPTEEN